MRVTSNNMMNSYLKDVQKNLQGMNKINNQISTGNQVIYFFYLIALLFGINNL